VRSCALELKNAGRKPGKRDQRQINISNQKREQILNYIESSGPSSIADINRSLGINRRIIKKHLDYLIDYGKIKQKNNLYMILVENESKLSNYEIEILNKIPDYEDDTKDKIMWSSLHEPYDIGRVFIRAEPESKLIFGGLFEELIDDFYFYNLFWLKYIFKVALFKGVLNEEYFIGKKQISDIEEVELDKAWKSIFNDTEHLSLILHLNPVKLLEWLKTDKGKDELKNLLDIEVLNKIYLDYQKNHESWPFN